MFTRYSKFDLAFLDNPFSVVLEEWVAGGGQVSLNNHFPACIEDIGIMTMRNNFFDKVTDAMYTF